MRRPAIGGIAPAFALTGTLGPVASADLVGAPALVVFYRGHW